MTDNDDDKLISLDDAARREIPKCGGKSVHRSSIIRWHSRGVVARNGDRVRLRLVRFGKRFYVTRRSIREFGEALAAADLAHFEQHSRSPGTGARRRGSESREGDIAAAEKRLASAGVLRSGEVSS